MSHAARGRANRAKGKRFELLMRKFWADRMVGKTHIGDDDPDLTLRLGHKRAVVECKDVQKLDLPGWLRQAEATRDAYGADIAVICHKRRGYADGGQQWITMSTETFERMCAWIEGF